MEGCSIYTLTPPWPHFYWVSALFLVHLILLPVGLELYLESQCACHQDLCLPRGLSLLPTWLGPKASSWAMALCPCRPLGLGLLAILQRSLEPWLVLPGPCQMTE
jgi:hypothetical protein